MSTIGMPVVARPREETVQMEEPKKTTSVFGWIFLIIFILILIVAAILILVAMVAQLSSSINNGLLWGAFGLIVTAILILILGMFMGMLKTT